MTLYAEIGKLQIYISSTTTTISMGLKRGNVFYMHEEYLSIEMEILYLVTLDALESQKFELPTVRTTRILTKAKIND